MKVVPLQEFKSYAGREIGTSDWMVIDQNRIDRFADATLDRQFIHVDPERAASTPFGGTIAHGYLTLSLTPNLLSQVSVVPEGMTMAVNYGMNKVRFLQPVKVDSSIRVRLTLKEISERSPGTFLVRSDIAVEIRGEEKPALVAETLALYVTGPG